MRSFVLALVGVVVVAGVALVVATDRLAQPKFDDRLEHDPIAEIEIAPLGEALTFARRIAPEPAVLIVTEAGPDGLRAVDLGAALDREFDDAIEAIGTVGTEAIARVAREGEAITVEYASLGLPFEAGARHVAAGTNYRAHAEEVGVDDGPFLFPKLTAPTSWNADVPDRDRLDHEIEICTVTLERGDDASPAPVGFSLCNDFTDRWTLLRQIDFDQPMGVTGFPDAKGGPGMLPIGPLLVVPHDQERFHDDLELSLYVNGALRQQARGGWMVWSPDEITRQANAHCDVDYQAEVGAVRLPTCDGMPARTIVLTGTPAGVMFHPATVWSKAAYLQPGDEVIAVATHLGVLRNVVR